MMHTLNIKRWRWITIRYGKDQRPYKVRCVPGTNEKVVLFSVPVGQESCFFWHDRRRDQWVRVMDVYALHRAFAHITWNNAIEITTLEQVFKDLQTVQFEISMPGLSPDTRRELKKIIGANVALLEYTIDQNKVDACEQLMYLFDLQDSKGRRNPGVLLCRCRATIEPVERRIENVFGISAAFARHRGIVRRLVWCSEHILTTAEEQLRAFTAYPKRITAQGLTAVLGDMEQLRLPPFSWNSGLVCQELTDALGLLEKGEKHRPSVLPLVRKTWESLRCKQSRALLEKALLLIAEAEENGALASEKQKIVLALVASSHNMLSPMLVTEAGFVEPVRDKVRNHLTTAINFLNTRGEKKGGALDDIKKEVKRAANLL